MSLFAEGPQGPAGPPGKNSRQVYSGSGAPAASLGADDDHYIDTTAKVLYGPKTAGAWGAGVAIGGASSPTGSGLAKVSGGAFVSAASALLNADVDAAAAIAGTKVAPDFGSQTVQTTGAVQGATVRGTGNIDEASSGGTLDDYDATGATIIRFTSATPPVLRGIAGGVHGRQLFIMSVGGGNVTVSHENAGSAAANRITCYAAADSAAYDGCALHLIYDGIGQRWRQVL